MKNKNQELTQTATKEVQKMLEELKGGLNDINGTHINEANLNRYKKAVSDFKELMPNANIMAETPNKHTSATVVTIEFQLEDFEGERKDKLLDILRSVDGFSLSCSRSFNGDIPSKTQIIFSVDNIWEE